MIDKQRYGTGYALLTWITSFKLTKLVFALLVLLILLPIVNYYLVITIAQPTTSKRSAHNQDNQSKRNQQFYERYSLHDFHEILDKKDNLDQRLTEIFKIRESILNELAYLENKRQRQQEEITSYALKLDEVKSQIVHKQNELTRIHLSLEQAEYSRKEVVLKNRPFISNPLRIVDDNLFQVNLTTNTIQSPSDRTAKRQCSMHHCFDYSKCPLTKKLSIVLHRQFIDQPVSSDDEFSRLLKAYFIDYCESNFKLTSQLDQACLIVLPVLDDNQLNLIPNDLINRTNVLLVNFDLINQSPKVSFKGSSLAMIAQNNFYEHSFRNKFDLILPSLQYMRHAHKRNQLITSTVKRYLHCPAKRKYFISSIYNKHHQISQFQNMSLQLISVLKGIFNDSLNKFDSFYFDFNYSSPDQLIDEHLIDIYSQSTFTLIWPNDDLSKVSSEQIHQQLAAVLSTNSIPVLLGDYQIELPFNEVVDWRLAVIKLPLARVSELHLVLKSINDNDLLKMRRFGRMFYERYLSRVDYLINSLFSIFKSKRLQLPLNSVQDEESNLVYNKNDRPMQFYEINTELLENANEIEENLGPIEPPIPSITYQRNYSLVLTETYSLWNSELMNPFFMFPNLPFDPILPSEAKFKGSSYGFRPIGNGLGGSGKEFNENIGGNHQKEQFTIVMLTFERESVLMDSLQRLKGLPYLNKIVIVWNSKRLPGNEIKWPDLGVEIVVVKEEKNSLNNRFKPYNVIETEAILSMDDDVHLRHDEIMFGFRVWRESRERIVGFPGRFHAWSQNEWFYNANYSCELSMVLTGAAFFHKYYSYAYTHLMDGLIRDKVDELVNCEDLAFNFMVAHLTRKPPLKVTSRWTFRCPACPMSLSEDDSHFEERHRCINFFTSIYGYNPLLYTQFRADSILFKTRIPQNKQKCFKLI